MKKNADMAILVYSCWKNRDMWRIFLKLFRKYWQNCPYRLILLTDKYNGKGEAYDFDDIVVCDSNWHDMIMAGIECAGTEYIMLWMDDYLLCDYIQNEDIAYYVEKARKPLFTTGGDERSGMGFTIMESFMDKLLIRSAPGRGTTVTMRKRLSPRIKASK